jgi:hypothetical protein
MRSAIVVAALLGTCGCSSKEHGANGGGGTTSVSTSAGATAETAGGLAGNLATSSGGTSNGGTSSGGTASGGSASGGTTSALAGGGGTVAGGATGSGGVSSGTQWTSRAIANPPSYMGSASGSSGCTVSSATLGFEPADAPGGKHPLFFYFVGTTFSSSDTSARYDSVAAKTVTEAMARRGFVALSVQYDNTLSLSTDKLTCLYASSNAQSALAVACALPQVDCNLGIATWGHSQGALMAHAASQFEPRVRAVWTTGYSGGSFPLSTNRLRVVNGEGDTMNGRWDTIKKAAGFGSSECPDDGRADCLRPDGSGFIIVRKSDCVTSSADHCWFDRRFCGDGAITLEPNWTDKKSSKPFALEANADWVARTATRQ